MDPKILKLLEAAVAELRTYAKIVTEGSVVFTDSGETLVFSEHDDLRIDLLIQDIEAVTVTA